MPTNDNSNKLLIFLAFAAIYIVWGSTYLAALIALRGLPPFLMGGLRFLAAGTILTIWCRLRNEPTPDRDAVRKNAVSGTLTLVGGTGSVVWSEQYIPSGIVAILVAALPIWFVVLDRKQWAAYFSNKLIIGGLLVGFAGILLLFGHKETSPQTVGQEGMQVFSIVVLMLGSISWVAGSLFAKYQPAQGSNTVNSSLQLLTAGVGSLIVSGVKGEWSGFSFAAVPDASWLALTYSVLIGSVVTYSAYIYLLQIRPAAQVGTYAYVNPVIAVLLGWQFAGETISGRQLLALGMILGGVLLVNLPKYKTSAA